jgi:predicted RNA-binding protein Jag
MLDAMNSKERWVVHNYLKDVPGVTSVSEGEGAEKRIKVIPD